jgi:hypothetical protein
MGGIPGSAVTVKLLSVGQTTQGCWQNGTAPPAGYGLSVSGGYVNVTIPKQVLSGYRAVWTAAVNDHSLCATSTFCTSPAATVLIRVVCG